MNRKEEKRMSDVESAFTCAGILVLFVLSGILFYNGFMDNNIFPPEVGKIRSLLLGAASLGFSLGWSIVFLFKFRSIILQKQDKKSLIKEKNIKKEPKEPV